MKRELAALEAGSLLLDSVGRKTRSSKQLGSADSNGDSVGLVYKRVKRYGQVQDGDLLSDSSNGVVKDLNDHDMQKELENTLHERVEREVGASGVSTEPVKSSGGVCDDLVESTCDEGVKVVAEPSMVGVQQKDTNGDSLAVEGKEITPEDIEDAKISTGGNGAGKDINGDFLGVEREVKELPPEDVMVLTVGNGGAMNLPIEDNGLVKNVQTDEEVYMESQDVSLMGASDPVVNTVNANDAITEVDKDRVERGSLVKSPSPIVNGKEKNSSVERYTRRFTRSALNSKVDTLILASDSGMQNEENADAMTMTSKSNAEVGSDGMISRTHLTENNGEFKNSSVEKHSKRFTRSSLKPKVNTMDSSLMEASDSVINDKENTEPVISDENAEADVDKVVEESMLATPKRKMEMKMSKQISLAKPPTTVKELLETGLLEGCPVYYSGGKGPRLHGRIRGLGILCSCGLCQGHKVIPPSLFEIHACNIYKRAAQYICLENGRSFIQILKTCKSTRQSTLEATVQNAIGPLPEKKLVFCQNCKELFSTMDTDSSEAVCSSCVMSNESPIGPVFSSRKMRSSKSACPLRPQSATSASDVHPDRSPANLLEKSTEAFHTPKLRSSPRFGRSSATKTAQNIAKNQEDGPVMPKTSSSLSMGKSSEAKACEKLMNSQKTCSSPTRQSPGTRTSEKLMKKSFKAALSPKPSGFTHVGKSSPANVSGKTTKRLKKGVFTPKPLRSPSVGSSSGNKTSGKITRKDIRLHKLVFEDDILPDGTELGYYVRGKKLLDGYKKGSGIFCSCCETVISASLFEAHAGCASRRKPYCYIYTSNGVSLHELSVKLIQDRTHSTKFNDDLCSICADGGNLLLCDGCPRAFHTECASLSSVPPGKWYCKYCQNMFEREKFVAHNANALAAGRISGVDPMEQITTRSIRIVDTMASELSSCILCRGYDFCKSGFGPRTIILCDQCEKEYHVGCLKDHNMANLTELPEGKWFCSMDCGRIDYALQNLLVQGDEKLPESLVDIIRKKHLEKGSDSATDFDVSWRLLSGKIASPETRPLLSQAVSIFHESFAPIIDAMSAQDLIAAMVYGRSVAGQDYGGMYCAVLTVNSVVVSAGIFRVFGPEIAELPLVATSTDNQGKGYFQALFTCIERLLAFLKVKSLVLPAAEEAKSIWTDHFGFTDMTPDQLREIKRNYWSIVRFQGTSMLHKPVPECRVIQNPAAEK